MAQKRSGNWPSTGPSRYFGPTSLCFVCIGVVVTARISKGKRHVFVLDMSGNNANSAERHRFDRGGSRPGESILAAV